LVRHQVQLQHERNRGALVHTVLRACGSGPLCRARRGTPRAVMRGMRATDDMLVTGQFGPWRQAWLLAGFAVLLLVASAKLVLVDHALRIATYPAIGGVGFAIVAGIQWTRSGVFWITKTAIHTRRRVGPTLQILISEIRTIETGSRKRPRLVIAHEGGSDRLDMISGRDRSVASLRSLGVRLT
jgi:hypothetical protein